ncbi:hypothetical protein ASPWEDRAFT_62326 [Aspergillus wentii DTO 134E9]|uniref:Protein-S-isoprenylcysteine O-methyltransferase n=1 Tax=Aspergillus wentii DTO 134E9 TaxID=1073089 RepID=A0A1L9R7V5_ASPWE|nr:uncharacterized protein ASPWEDRAFT_62326 [Aspergillus wentii DTO 134E9]OJJ31005.1 hypothetical protein ASPWEDRAFT_62326 [Aspergillus wentii DTO 134E9]
MTLDSSSSSIHSDTAPTPTSKPPPPTDASNFPNGKKSLSGISIRAFLLGTTLGLSIFLAISLAWFASSPLWRVPFFLASLALFHFLEFWVTAEYNTRLASVSAFLLSSNGWAYNVAHGSAVVECIISYTFFPGSWYPNLTEPVPGIKVQVVIGVLLMVVGQVVRTLAMAQAGSNFNHTVQVELREGHQLVKNGVYAFLRHPSYFGFFWWGLGTQLVLGNVVCFVGYALVLWRFFSSRIQREERFLICFFGDEYVEYKKTTRVGIPAIP